MKFIKSIVCASFLLSNVLASSYETIDHEAQAQRRYKAAQEAYESARDEFTAVYKKAIVLINLSYKVSYHDNRVYSEGLETLAQKLNHEPNDRYCDLAWYDSDYTQAASDYKIHPYLNTFIEQNEEFKNSPLLKHHISTKPAWFTTFNCFSACAAVTSFSMILSTLSKKPNRFAVLSAACVTGILTFALQKTTWMQSFKAKEQKIKKEKDATDMQFYRLWEKIYNAASKQIKKEFRTYHPRRKNHSRDGSAEAVYDEQLKKGVSFEDAELDIPNRYTLGCLNYESLKPYEIFDIWFEGPNSELYFASKYRNFY